MEGVATVPKMPDHWLEWANAYTEYLNAVQPQGVSQRFGEMKSGPSVSGGANRRGNYATTASAGQVAKSMASNPSMQTQAMERSAKRIGRNLSQSGTSSVPSLIRTAKYKQGY